MFLTLFYAYGIEVIPRNYAGRIISQVKIKRGYVRHNFLVLLSLCFWNFSQDTVFFKNEIRADEIHRATVKPEMPQRTTTMSFTSTTPWDKTGFYYSPRYPQSHKGTASTYSSSFSRRYPVRRFVPSYVPFRYSRRF